MIRLRKRSSTFWSTKPLRWVTLQFWGDDEIVKSSSFPIQQHGQKVLEHADQREELVSHVRASKLKELNLEDRKAMG